MSELETNTEVKIGSEKSFGIVFSVVFAIVALLPLLGDGGVRFWALGISAVFLGLAFVKPTVLALPNRLWFRLGLLLNKIVSPIVMGLIFVLTVIPTGLILRARGKDPLRKKMDPGAETYWITPEAGHHGASSMKNQF
jgi:predicted membrane metal-binding protein